MKSWIVVLIALIVSALIWWAAGVATRYVHQTDQILVVE